MHILVTGGNGFIGSHVVDALQAANASVSVVDVAPERYRTPLPGVSYFQGGFGDQAVVESVLKRQTDVVIHLAGFMLPQRTANFPESDIRNLSDSVKLFQVCAAHRVKKIIFMSSGGTVYGIPKRLPIRETDQTDPVCSYGVIKLAIEKYLKTYAYEHSFDAVILRPANPYGVRQAPIGAQGAIPIFMWKILNEEVISVWGNGDIVRDFVHIGDVARFCALASLNDCRGVFNLGSGVGTSLADLIREISEVLNMKARVRREPARKFDVPAIVLDRSRARQQFDWKPEIEMSKGLLEVADWLRELRDGSCLLPHPSPINCMVGA